ncbi:uncharacterized protein LOC135398203 [Ornithodoros turicata]|uniref:uncharacterized protein LOC135398203 n=1 Tax=Ornithodoros turicata TaxID=34597 RepID=UPI0031396335
MSRLLSMDLQSDHRVCSKHFTLDSYEDFLPDPQRRTQHRPSSKRKHETPMFLLMFVATMHTHSLVPRRPNHPMAKQAFVQKLLPLRCPEALATELTLPQELLTAFYYISTFFAIDNTW